MELKGVTAIEYINDIDGSPLILINSRNDTGEKQITEISNIKPYVYIDKKDEQKLRYNTISNVKIEDTDKEYILDKNKKMVKVILKSLNSVYEFKRKFNCAEDDVPFVNKWLIDNVTSLTSAKKYRINYLDIETTSVKGFPNYLNAVENIISLACYDNILDKSFLWIYHNKYEPTIIQQQVEEGTLEIRRFNAETNMLNDFLDFIVETKPDFITSWHVAFDITYLVARLERLNLNAQKLSPFYGTKYTDKFYCQQFNGTGKRSLVGWGTGPGVYGKRFGISDKEKHVIIKGLHYFDMLTAYKNIIAKEQESFKLDYIAQKELGINKLRTHFDIGEEWLKNPEFIEQYNYIDVFLIKKLDEKMKIMNRYLTIRNKSFLANINDVFSTGRVLDTYILKKYKDKYIFPSKIFDMSRERRIAGGLVREPKAKLYRNIAVFDFSGFYPSLMTTFNLSSEKLVKEEIIIFDPTIEENVDIESIMPNKMYEWNSETKEIIYKIKTPKFTANLTYKLDEPGVLTTAVKDLIVLRNEAKKEMKKYNYGSVEYEQAYNNQFSYKFLINGIYGACAYPGFRLFKLHNANAITAFARMLSKWVEHKLKENGWETVIGDTDSLFIQLHDENAPLQDNLKEINELIFPIINNAIIEFLNKYLPLEFISSHTLKIEMEKIYKTFLLPEVKKRYIGLLKYYDGKEVSDLHYMGIDSKKSNTIKICKEAQLELANTILKDGNINEVFNKYYEQLKNANDIELFKIPSKLEKEKYAVRTPAVKASEWSNKNLKTKFRQGTKFYIIYVAGISDTNSIAFENAEQLKHLNITLDKEKYIKDLYKKFDNLISGIPEIAKLNDEYYDKYRTKKVRKLKKDMQTTL